MAVPTRAEVLEQLRFHAIKCQELSAMMAHLENASGLHGTPLARGWLAVELIFKQIQHTVRMLAMGRLQ